MVIEVISTKRIRSTTTPQLTRLISYWSFARYNMDSPLFQHSMAYGTLISCHLFVYGNYSFEMILIVHGRLRLVSRGASKRTQGATDHVSLTDVLLLHLRWNFTADSGSGISKCTEQKKGKDRRQIQAKNWRNQATEQVQVRISDCVDRLQSSNALSLREPAKKDTDCDDKIVLKIGAESHRVSHIIL